MQIVSGCGGRSTRIFRADLGFKMCISKLIDPRCHWWEVMKYYNLFSSFVSKSLRILYVQAFWWTCWSGFCTHNCISFGTTLDQLYMNMPLLTSKCSEKNWHIPIEHKEENSARKRAQETIVRLIWLVLSWPVCNVLLDQCPIGIETNKVTHIKACT
jgi:hypothetical protein